MTQVLRSLSALALLLALVVQPAGAQRQQTPRFRTSVEVTSIDVTVVDGQGHPIPNLQPEDFTVRVDGTPRRVVSAEWVQLSTKDQPVKPAAAAPEGFSSNESATGDR